MRYSVKLSASVCILTLMSCLGLSAAPAAAADVDALPPAPETGWEFTVAPYLWLAGIKGDVAAFGGPPISIDATIPDVLSSLDIGLMGVGQARYGRFSLAADVFWVKLSDDGPMPRQLLANKYDLTITNTMLTGVAGYSLIHDEGMTLDIVAGARYWSVDNNLKFKGAGKACGLPNAPKLCSLDGVSLDDDQDWVDPVIGFKGNADLSDKVFVTGWALAGGFGVSSEYMWDAMGSVGYRFNDWSSATLGFRAMGVDYKQDGFEYDVIQYGPMMGAVFHF
ncbi:MAG: hypothetical protein U1F47_02700 [Hyphomicrobiales bacterium]